MTKNKYQYRELELRGANFSENDGKMVIEGYAVVFDSPTVLYKRDGVEYKEQISKSAFEKCDMSDCCLKYNHGGMLLARCRGGSLKLTVDDKGLYFRAELFDTTVARDVYNLIQNGGLDKCSFAFSVSDDEYDKKTHTRTILGIDKLYDVAVVDIPAYQDTSVNARGLFDMEIENERIELDNQKLREKLILETYL
jgi:hypothetical protein